MNNPTLKSFGKEEIHQLIPNRFKQVVAQFPNRPALKEDGKTSTYKELDNQATDLSAAISKGKKSSTVPVGLLLAHESVLIAAILGTLKSGRPYVYLDPSYPGIHLNKLISDSGTNTIVTKEDFEKLIGSEGLQDGQIIEVDKIQQASADPRPLSISPESGYCILYTSGSNGEAKGVVHNHQCLLFNVRNYTKHLQITEKDRMTLLTSASFAASCTAMFGALLNGACLFPFDFKKEGIRSAVEWMEEEEITIYHSVPTLFRFLAKNLPGKNNFPKLRYIKLGGETVLRSDIELFKNKFGPQCTLVNGLGMTEAGGNIAYFFINHNTKITKSIVPVGYPVEGKKVFVIDDHGKALPKGEIGEICVKSQYLASAYWGRPEQSLSTFKTEFGSKETLLQTGDLGRIDLNHCLEYLGRKDQQTKVRGFRVNLEEIEAILNGHPDLIQSIVVTKNNVQGGTCLSAYFIPKDRGFVDLQKLRAFLLSKLPKEMIPSSYIQVDRFPVSLSGKVDRQALTKYSNAASNLKTSKAPPESSLEHQLCQIWEDLFEVYPIGIDDNFFEIGGHSILAAQLLQDIEKTCDIRLSPKVLLEHPTIDKLAKEIEKFYSPKPSLGPIQLNGKGAKKRLFFLHGNVTVGGYYCVNLSRKLGCNQPFIILQPVEISPTFEIPEIEIIAKLKIEEIRTVQPNGPYRIGGYCIYGLIAFEIAQQLRQQGESIENLFLIDSDFRKNWEFPVRMMTEIFGFLFNLDHRVKLGFYQEATNGLQRNLNITLLESSKKPMGIAKKFQAIKRLLFSLFQSKPKIDQENPKNEAQLTNNSQDKYLMAAYSWIRARYRPTPYPGLVTLFLSDNWAQSRMNIEKKWQYCAKSIKIHKLPGDHQTCITRHVDVLAKFLRKYLND